MTTYHGQHDEKVVPSQAMGDEESNVKSKDAADPGDHQERNNHAKHCSSLVQYRHGVVEVVGLAEQIKNGAHWRLMWERSLPFAYSSPPSSLFDKLRRRVERDVKSFAVALISFGKKGFKPER